jgi:hypothetical protein
MADTTREALAAEAKRLAEEYADQHKANGALRWKTLHALFATIDRLATPEQAPAVQAGALAERWAGYARLLKEARRYLGDKRLYHDELDGRKRRETNQEHVDRISRVIQENEDLRTLVDEIDAALATTPAVQAEQPAEPTTGARHKRDVWIDYTNWRGERGIRHIRPQELLWLSTEYHREPQWLLHAWDVEKQAKRDFALKDIHAISLTPLVATRGQAEPTEGNWIAADDYRRNVRALDVALNGEEGAAQRPSLVDVLAQVQGEVRRRGRPLLADPKGQAEDAQRLTDEQIDAAVAAWFKAPVIAGRQPFASRMRAAIDAARASDARKGEAS